MKIHGFLQPFMLALYQGNPTITTAEAVAEIGDFLARQEEGELRVDEAANIGFASVWGNFTGGLRQRAQSQLKAATMVVAPNGSITIHVFENMKLPLPDADLSPTYADSTAIMLRESIRYMRAQLGGLERQIAFAEQVADSLDAADLAANESGLTVRAAFTRGLLDLAGIAPDQTAIA